MCVNSNVWKVFPEYLGINSIPSWHFPCPCHTAPGNAELLATPRNSPELLFCPVASREATELGQGLQSLLLPCQSSSTTSTSSRPRGWIRWENVEAGARSILPALPVCGAVSALGRLRRLALGLELV